VLFFDRLDQALTRSLRDGKPPAVLYVDLDRFKTVNDSLGHDAGDQVLLAVADRLRAAIRAQDTACRLGGDEFAVLCEAVDETDEVLRVGRRIARAVDAPLEVTISPPHQETTTSAIAVRASVGVAIATRGQRATDVVRDADQAMYAAKGQGGGQVQLFSPAVRQRSSRQLDLELSLRRIVGTAAGQVPSALGGIELHYQPIVALGTGRIVGLEALVRWHHQHLGAVPARELIATAELSGLIVPLGAALLSDACRRIRTWAQDNGLPGLDLCVNVSTLQLVDPSFLSW
jgi:diguanylate cyclase (GGDEF)-like protein